MSDATAHSAHSVFSAIFSCLPDLADVKIWPLDVTNSNLKNVHHNIPGFSEYFLSVLLWKMDIIHISINGEFKIIDSDFNSFNMYPLSTAFKFIISSKNDKNSKGGRTREHFMRVKHSIPADTEANIRPMQLSEDYKSLLEAWSSEMQASISQKKTDLHHRKASNQKKGEGIRWTDQP